MFLCPAFYEGSELKLSLSACKASTVPAKLSLASAQLFFLHLNPSLLHHLWVCFPQYSRVLKPSSDHVCIKCTPANEVALKPARTGAGCPQPRPQCTSELLHSSLGKTCPSIVGQSSTLTHLVLKAPILAGQVKMSPAVTMQNPFSCKQPAIECHVMTCGRPHNDCVGDHVMTVGCP